MVSYQRWTSLVFEVAKEKGAHIDDISDGSNVVAVGAAIWRDRKAELKAASVAEAREIARSEIVA